MAVATHTHPRQWLADDLDLMVTVVDVLNEQTKREERAR